MTETDLEQRRILLPNNGDTQLYALVASTIIQGASPLLIEQTIPVDRIISTRECAEMQFPLLDMYEQANVPGNLKMLQVGLTGAPESRRLAINSLIDNLKSQTVNYDELITTIHATTDDEGNEIPERIERRNLVLRQLETHVFVNSRDTYRLDSLTVLAIQDYILTGGGFYGFIPKAVKHYTEAVANERALKALAQEITAQELITTLQQQIETNTATVAADPEAILIMLQNIANSDALSALDMLQQLEYIESLEAAIKQEVEKVTEADPIISEISEIKGDKTQKGRLIELQRKLKTREQEAILNATQAETLIASINSLGLFNTITQLNKKILKAIASKRGLLQDAIKQLLNPQHIDGLANSIKNSIYTSSIIQLADRPIELVELIEAINLEALSILQNNPALLPTTEKEKAVFEQTINAAIAKQQNNVIPVLNGDLRQLISQTMDGAAVINYATQEVAENQLDQDVRQEASAAVAAAAELNIELEFFQRMADMDLEWGRVKSLFEDSNVDQRSAVFRLYSKAVQYLAHQLESQPNKTEIAKKAIGGVADILRLVGADVISIPQINQVYGLIDLLVTKLHDSSPLEMLTIGCPPYNSVVGLFEQDDSYQIDIREAQGFITDPYISNWRILATIGNLISIAQKNSLPISYQFLTAETEPSPIELIAGGIDSIEYLDLINITTTKLAYYIEEQLSNSGVNYVKTQEVINGHAYVTFQSNDHSINIELGTVSAEEWRNKGDSSDHKIGQPEIANTILNMEQQDLQFKKKIDILLALTEAEFAKYIENYEQLDTNQKLIALRKYVYTRIAEIYGTIWYSIFSRKNNLLVYQGQSPLINEIFMEVVASMLKTQKNKQIQHSFLYLTKRDTIKK